MKLIKTKLTEKLGIKYPIVCGGMHQVGLAPLASAVSNAGGLGMITALTQPSPEDLRKEIQKCRTMTSKPFGVNLTILPMLIPADYDAYVEVICAERVNVVEISGGSPRKYMPLFRQAGVVVIHKSATIKHALKAEKDGVDFIEIAGFESSIAGRASDDDIGTWVLLTKALNVLKTPVLLSGSSATGRQLAMAIAAGAQGFTMGTRFLATEECQISSAVKKWVADPKNDEYSTTLTLKSFNNATRVAKNSVAKEIIELEKTADGDFSKIAALAAGERGRKMFRENGDPEDAMWSCGMSVGLINEIMPCKDLLDGIVAQAIDQLSHGYNSIVVSKL